MEMKKIFKNVNLLVFIFSFLLLCFCNTRNKEVINLDELLPGGAIIEITNGHPDFKVTFVAEKNANVAVKFGEKFMRVDGIEDEEVREKMKRFVERLKTHYPDLEYEWVALDEGNVKVEYGDNSLIIKGKTAFACNPL